MRACLALVSLLALVNIGLAKDDNGNIYAVLVAGSSSWWNYRHQSDIAHAYQVLKTHGVKAENVITFMYDDLVTNVENPFPGKLFNQPNGKDVYAGVKIDYKGDDVNVDNFIAVMKGDASGVSVAGGRVLKSGKNDKVFVYFTDHGAPGIVALPEDEMTVQQLNETLEYMFDKKMYGQLVFYLEACESGSMFEGVLNADRNILALTASNAEESSWGCYCDDKNIDTCLGDLFSVSWMEDSDIEDLAAETLDTQFKIVRNKTDLSHVMRYGDLTINPEAVAAFQGHTASKSNRNAKLRNRWNPSKHHEKWNSRDIPIKTVERQLARETNPVKKHERALQLALMKSKRAYLDMHTAALVKKLVNDKITHAQILTYKPARINDIACHHAVVKAYSKQCFNFGQNPYAMAAAGAPLANLCDHQSLSTEQIVKTIEKHCAARNMHMTNIH